MELIWGILAGIVLMLLAFLALGGVISAVEEGKAKGYARRHGWRTLPGKQYFKVYNFSVKVETRAQPAKCVPVMHLSPTDILELPQMSTKREVMQLSDWIMGNAFNMVPQGQPITSEVIQEIYTRTPRPRKLTESEIPPVVAVEAPAADPAHEPPSREYRRILADKDRLE